MRFFQEDTGNFPSHPRQAPTRCSRSENCSPKIADPFSQLMSSCSFSPTMKLGRAERASSAIHLNLLYSALFLVIFYPIRSSLDSSVIFLFPAPRSTSCSGASPWLWQFHLQLEPLLSPTIRLKSLSSCELPASRCQHSQWLSKHMTWGPNTCTSTFQGYGPPNRQNLTRQFLPNCHHEEIRDS